MSKEQTRPPDSLNNDPAMDEITTSSQSTGQKGPRLSTPPGSRNLLWDNSEGDQTETRTISRSSSPSLPPANYTDLIPSRVHAADGSSRPSQPPRLPNQFDTGSLRHPGFRLNPPPPQPERQQSSWASVKPSSVYPFCCRSNDMPSASSRSSMSADPIISSPRPPPPFAGPWLPSAFSGILYASAPSRSEYTSHSVSSRQPDHFASLEQGDLAVSKEGRAHPFTRHPSPLSAGKGNTHSLDPSSTDESVHGRLVYPSSNPSPAQMQQGKAREGSTPADQSGCMRTERTHILLVPQVLMSHYFLPLLRPYRRMTFNGTPIEATVDLLRLPTATGVRSILRSTFPSPKISPPYATQRIRHGSR